MQAQVNFILVNRIDDWKNFFYTFECINTFKLVCLYIGNILWDMYRLRNLKRSLKVSNAEIYFKIYRWIDIGCLNDCILVYLTLRCTTGNLVKVDYFIKC